MQCYIVLIKCLCNIYDLHVVYKPKTKDISLSPSQRLKRRSRGWEHPLSDGNADPGLSLVLICRRHTWDIAAGMAWDTVIAYVNVNFIAES